MSRTRAAVAAAPRGGQAAASAGRGARSGAKTRGAGAAAKSIEPPPLPGFASAVQRWQRRHGRSELPWVGERDPYRVWLSEVMLQQTQVATVLDYYRRFLERFPTVHDLAAAPQEQVLALWSGLGYYSRARHLHRCAQQVVAEHGGRFPRASAALARLPGIGRSTAAAIAAFCFGERTAILDGNVKRVLARVLGFDADLAQAAAERRLWAHAEALLPRTGIEAYTQGLMDLGATVCTPREPRCARCPAAGLCVARAQDRVLDYPVRTRRLRRGQRSNVLLWLEHRGRWWLVQRPSRGVWSGLMSLPLFDDQEAVRAATRGWPGRCEPLPAFVHVLTHFDWTLQPVRWRLASNVRLPDIERATGPGRWLSPDEALAAGLPAPQRRLFEQAGVEPGLRHAAAGR